MIISNDYLLIAETSQLIETAQKLQLASEDEKAKAVYERILEKDQIIHSSSALLIY